MPLAQLTNEATRLLALERATRDKDEARRLQSERDRIETQIRERYTVLLK